MSLQLNQGMFQNIIKQPAIWKRLINQIVQHQSGIDRLKQINKRLCFMVADEMMFIQDDIEHTVAHYLVYPHIITSISQYKPLNGDLIVMYRNDTQMLSIRSEKELFTISLIEFGYDDSQLYTVFFTSYFIIMLLMIIKQSDFDQFAYQIAMASEDCERFINHSLSEALNKIEQHENGKSIKSKVWLINKHFNSLLEYYHMSSDRNDYSFCLKDVVKNEIKPNVLTFSVFDEPINFNMIQIGQFQTKQANSFLVSIYLLTSFFFQVVCSCDK